MNQTIELRASSNINAQTDDERPTVPLFASSNESARTDGERPIAPPIAIRKSCSPEGIGLSHYVLMDKRAAK